MSKYFHQTRYTSKVISREQLEKAIILFKLKRSNLEIDGVNLDQQGFNIEKYIFDKNNDIIVSIVQDHIEHTYMQWEEVPQYEDCTLCYIYDTGDYLPINNELLDSLPSIMTKKDLLDEDILWCTYDCWKQNQIGYNDEEIKKQEHEIFKQHANRISKLLWHIGTDVETLEFLTNDRYARYEEVFDSIGYSYKTTEAADEIFNKHFNISI